MIESFIVFSGYILIYFFFRNSAVGMIEEVRINFKLYPKHYVRIPRWMQNHFKIKRKEIPKYLFFRLCISLFFGILAPIVAVMCLIIQQQAVIGFVIFIPCLFGILDTVQFIIVSHIFKK